MYLSAEKIQEIIDVAAKNDGHCDRCLRVIKVYKYGLSTMMAGIMKAMAQATKETGVREIESLKAQIGQAQNKWEVFKALIRELLDFSKKD